MTQQPAPKQQQQDEPGRWRQYEARKRVLLGWVRDKAEYEAAVKVVVEELGL